MTAKTIYAIIVLGLIAGTVSTGCESTPEKKIEDARENLQEAKHEVKEAVRDALTAYRDEWQTFKFDADAKIRDNEYTLNGYIKKMVKADATHKAIFNKRADELEKRNVDLKRRLAEYHDEGKDKWEKFRQGFTGDMDILQNSLKELNVDGK